MDRFRSTSSSRQPAKSLAPLPLRREASAEALLETNSRSHISELQVPKSKHKPMPLLSVFSRSSSASPVSPVSPMDRLPNDPTRLDGILNHHLSQLTRIRREVMAHNETIELLSYTLSKILVDPDLQYTADRMSARIQGVRNARNLLAQFVVYHLQEIDRASTMKRVLAGSRDIPEIFRRLPTDYQWNKMFSP